MKREHKIGAISSTMSPVSAQNLEVFCEEELGAPLTQGSQVMLPLSWDVVEQIPKPKYYTFADVQARYEIRHHGAGTDIQEEAARLERRLVAKKSKSKQRK